MTNSTEIKGMVKEMGADLCGVATTSRFSMAPQGFRPADIYPDCKSVLVFAKRVPTGPLYASSCVPYTYADDLITRQVGVYDVGQIEDFLPTKSQFVPGSMGAHSLYLAERIKSLTSLRSFGTVLT